MKQNTKIEFSGAYATPEMTVATVQTETGFAASQLNIQDLDYTSVDNWE